MTKISAYQVKARRQHGIVLISCLIFLVLILGLLRISLGSSMITEKKSGIGMDMLSATESAEIALRVAESTFLQDASNYSACDGDSTSINCQRARIWGAQDWWSKDSNLSATDGLYDGTAINGACGPGSTNNRPLWECVSWGTKFNKSYGVTQNQPSIEVSDNARYIIERFPADSMGITSGVGLNSILLRVTAVGFGRGTANGRPTNVLLQSNYLIP